MSHELSIMFCCVQPRDEGQCINQFYRCFFIDITEDICGVFEYLAELQNAFVNKALELAASGCRSLLYLRSEDQCAGLLPIPLQEIGTKDIINN